MTVSIGSSFFAGLSSTKATGGGNSFSSPVAGKSDAAEAFLEEAKKTPADRIKDAILKKRGLSEEQFAALDAKDRAAIMDEVKAEMLRQIQAGTGSKVGFYTDTRA